MELCGPRGAGMGSEASPPPMESPSWSSEGPFCFGSQRACWQCWGLEGCVAMTLGGEGQPAHGP